MRDARTARSADRTPRNKKASTRPRFGSSARTYPRSRPQTTPHSSRSGKGAPWQVQERILIACADRLNHAPRRNAYQQLAYAFLLLTGCVPAGAFDTRGCATQVSSGLKGRTDPAVMLGSKWRHQQFIIKRVDDAGEPSTTFVAFEAVTFKSARVDAGCAGSGKRYQRSARRTRDTVRVQYQF
jgi:hypothetical protein